MGMYALNMMDIALEIASEDVTFEDSATKFYEHFVIIAEALNELALWNKKDSFFYDVLSLPGKTRFHLPSGLLLDWSPYSPHQLLVTIASIN